MPLTTRTMAYSDQDTALTGELHWDTGSAPRPGILLIHGGAGLDDHARGQASRYAALGYAVFASAFHTPGDDHQDRRPDRRLS